MCAMTTDVRVPVTLLETNACSPLATNGLAGNIWDNFSSSAYKSLPSVGKVQIQEKHEPESYKLLMEGKGGPGFVKGSGHIHLADKGDQTEIRCDSEVQVGGMIAAIGSRLVEAIGKKMMDDFFNKFAQEAAKQ